RVCRAARVVTADHASQTCLYRMYRADRDSLFVGDPDHDVAGFECAGRGRDHHRARQFHPVWIAVRHAWIVHQSVAYHHAAGMTELPKYLLSAVALALQPEHRR